MFIPADIAGFRSNFQGRNFEEANVHKKTLTGESNASDDFRIGRGSRRDGCRARDGVRFQPCGWQPQVYVAPVVTHEYSGCNPCGGGWGGGWAHERLADPEQQYYYVNQGPTYTGPGNWAPEPTYHESSVSYGNPYYSGHVGWLRLRRVPPSSCRLWRMPATTMARAWAMATARIAMAMARVATAIARCAATTELTSYDWSTT